MSILNFYLILGKTATLDRKDIFLDCQNKSLEEIAIATKDLIARSKNGSLRGEEYSGGTFSISNLGTFDVDNFIIGPTPDANYTSELHYFYRPASLTAGADGGTTWLSENATLALLYGCLVEAYTFMKGDPSLMQEYEKRLGEALLAMKMFGESKETTDEYMTGKVIRPKQ